ncbi:MAG TPA: lamin tail domain-containing protein, partial [Methylomirabilota bacterium]|nr:lamin tail domain-containing protein [Methylomirabilota bacterium]
MRHLAVMNLFGNSETGLNSGFNDDYNMYVGALDRRFHLLYWDMDSILGLSSFGSTSSIFSMEGGGGGAGAAFSRFIRWPEFEQIYYRTLEELLTTTMSQTNFNALIDATLGGYVGVGTINSMKTFMNERRAYVLGLIPALPNVDAPTATVTGTPRSPTPLRNATFTVSGVGAASYRFSLNGAAYGAETPLATPISLSLLPNGSNFVAVIAKGTNGVWQAMTNATVRGWVVDTSIPSVRLNEVLAQNNTALNHNSTFPDAIELFNEGSTTVDIGGLRLTDDNAMPNKFTFPPGTLLAPGSNLVVYANNADGTPGFHLGFGLDVSGDSVHLFASLANGGAKLDSVQFGRQLADLSMGRIGTSGEWQLTTPTFGSANALQSLGHQNNLRLNEWLTASLSQDDFIELYNVNALPVALGGLYFTDNLIGDRARNQIEPLTFIGPGEFVAFIANGNGNGGDDLNFSLALEHGEIGLFSADLTALDSVIYGSQLPDVAQGKCPNGSGAYAKLATPTPGAPNACTSEVLPGGGVVINELLANNATLEEPDGSRPDWIELYNSSGSAINLSDMSLTDDSAIPRRWVIPNGTILNSLAYLKVRCDAGLPGSSTNTGFGLSASGGNVFLFESIANGSGLRSSIGYGLQAADFSIGRIPGGSTNWVLTIPTLGGNNIAASLGDPLQLKINEWMADPASGDDDYFEIFNLNPLPADVSRFYLTDDLSNRTKHQLPLLSFIGAGAGAFQRFDADGNVASGADHVNFSLRAAGEAIGLTTFGNVAVDSINFGPQLTGVSEGRLPDGSATIVSFPGTPTPGNSNFRPLNNMLINELLSHSDPPLEDAVELYNPTDEPVDISGWYLSDSQDNLLKYRIPSNTVVEAGGYVVFYEYQLNDDLANFPFSFSSARGDDIYLSQTIAGALTGYRAFATFDAAENGVSFGRFRTSVGDDFTAMSVRSFGVDNPVTTNQFRLGTGLTNPYPKVGPVVINEIMYHPPGTNDALEFLELRNITAAAVPLYDTNNPANTWRLRSGVDFNFPPNTTIPAGGHLVVASFDPAADPISLAAFRGAYGSNMTLVGPYLGRLDNAGEAIELQKPDAPETTPGPDFGLVPYIVADRVVYGVLPPWPASPDGTGAALKKFTSTLYGNEPLNWQGGTPNPGALNFVAASNTPPTLNSISDRSVHIGSPISFTATASDVDLPGQTLTFTLDAPVPAGASIGF